MALSSTRASKVKLETCERGQNGKKIKLSRFADPPQGSRWEKNKTRISKYEPDTPQNIPKTQLKHPPNTLETSPEHPQIIPKTSLKYLQHIPKTSVKHT